MFTVVMIVPSDGIAWSDPSDGIAWSDISSPVVNKVSNIPVAAIVIIAPAAIFSNAMKRLSHCPKCGVLRINKSSY